MNRDEREARIRELRKWNTTEDAENTALELLAALPDSLDGVGIFASFSHVEDEGSGTGGIHFQCVSSDSLSVVDISPSGTFEDCHGLRGNDFVEYEPDSVRSAADFLLEAVAS